MSNATTPHGQGWDLLMDGKMIESVYTMFDQAMGGMGLSVVILFFIYQVMLYSKTQNLTVMFIMGVIFASLYATSRFVETLSVQIIFLLLVFLLAGILYTAFFMDKQ